jgi:hypothetical protein
MPTDSGFRASDAAGSKRPCSQSKRNLMRPVYPRIQPVDSGRRLPYARPAC